MLRLADIIGESIVDGDGVRVVVFLQGCKNTCEGCHNPDLKPIAGGRPIGEVELAELILKHVTPIHQGITFSGGEPMLQAEGLIKVIGLIKQKRPGLDIWMYTGYLFEEIAKNPVMTLIDVLVDGPYVKAQRSPAAQYFGSANQRIINVRASLNHKKVIMWQRLGAVL